MVRNYSLQTSIWLIGSPKGSCVGTFEIPNESVQLPMVTLQMGSVPFFFFSLSLAYYVHLHSLSLLHKA